MKLYIFRSSARPRMYGATRFETASNLPRCPGGWDFFERVDLALDRTLRFAIDPGTLRREIQKHSWHVWDESPPDSRRGAVAASKPVLVAQQPRPAKPETAAPIAAAPTMRPAVPEVAQVRPAPAASHADGFRERRDQTVAAVAAAATLPESRAAHSVTTPPARHQVVWFDIPVRDIDRALRFYSAVLGTQLKKAQAGPGVAMAELPHSQGSIGGCLVQNIDAKPSESGPLLYLNTQDRLEEALNAVEKHGGRVVSETQSIAPFGFRAIVLDSEGNRIALHSM